MNKFQVGDLVTSSRFDGIIVKTGFTYVNKPYSQIKCIKSQSTDFIAGGAHYRYDFEFTLVKRITKEKLLLNKINQLYERQSWIRAGKPTALY